MNAYENPFFFLSKCAKLKGVSVASQFIKYKSHCAYTIPEHFYEDAALPALKQTEYINQEAFSVLAHAPQINVIYWGVHTEHTL
jgi:hypothetical protein